MWSEDRLHRWLAGRWRRAPARALAGSPMHDAAVLRAGRGRVVACVDQTVCGVHFAPDAPAARVGAKAAGRALSDLAATAARPEALLLALAAPPDTPEAWIRAAIAALARAGAAHGADLVGGDLACAPGPTCLAVTALGRFDWPRRPPGRDRARVGQAVVLTGPVGGSSLGRHLRPEPRVREGRWLFEGGATAMMDVSDGLAWDLFRLARASGVGIDLEHVPTHADAERLARRSGRAAREHALGDGEDHELIATVPRRALPALLRAAPRRCPGLVVVGCVRAGRGLTLLQGKRRVPWSGEGGWRHGD